MKLEIRCNEGFISIEVLEYENCSAETSEDANWLSCYVAIKTDAFSGEFQASFMTEDFTDFQKQLAAVVESLEGSARFETMENALQFSVEMKSNGEAAIMGHANAVNAPRTVLSFSMTSDQSCTTETNTQLQAITTTFPVKTL